MNVPNPRERLFELLADRALIGLDPHEEGELAAMRGYFPDTDALAREIELAAAAVAIAGAAEKGLLQMPETMKRRIENASFNDDMATTILRGPDVMASAAANAAASEEAKRKLLKQTAPMAWQGTTSQPPAPPQAQQGQPMPGYGGSPSVIPPAYSQYPQQQQQPPAQPATRGAPVISLESARAGRERSGASRVVAVTGWLAAAACLMLAVGAWYFRPRTKVVTVNVPTPPPTVVAPTASAPPVLTPQQERESLLARVGTARIEWTKNAKDPASKQASGDVVWNATEQRGFMRFQGLAKNDKSANVYQLWIFDKTRDDKYPVDGGVFSIDDESGDVIVPIKARLPVGEAALFAVTVEKPGGVVVSKRERIVVTAKSS